MVEVDAASSSAGGRCGMVRRWLARRVAERVRQAGERRGGREPTDGLLLLTAGSSHGYREQQQEEDGGVAVTRDDTDGGLTAVCRSKGPRSFSVWGQRLYFSVCWSKNHV